jgi:hypothetical protein
MRDGGGQLWRLLGAVGGLAIEYVNVPMYGAVPSLPCGGFMTALH